MENMSTNRTLYICNSHSSSNSQLNCSNVACRAFSLLRGLMLPILATILFLQLGCDSNSNNTIKPPSNGLIREWTVMVYMSADDADPRYSLEPDAINDVNEMELSGSADRVAIVIQIDRVAGIDSSNNDWTTTRRYLITYDPSYDRGSRNPDRTIRSMLIAELGEINMGTPKALIDFVKWAKANYPAKRYALVLWNHGRGVDDTSPYRVKGSPHIAQFGILHPRGVIYDDTNEDFLTIPELGYALSEVKPIDVVAFDACLMGMVEVAYEIRNAASLMCASQLSPPDEGYRYDLWLGELKFNPTMTPSELAKVIVEKYVQSVGQNFAVAESAVKLSEVASLASAIDDFANGLRDVADKYEFELANARSETTYISDMPQFKDIYDYAIMVKKYVDDQTIHSLADKLIQRFRSAVLINKLSGNLDNFNGLSIYLPSPDEANITGSGYINLAFAKDTSWNEWLIEQRR
ncbi:MAG: clostripain-related cysteine peptidase [Armatimonadota bacterium]|nr:clostripain-related cysteine peptidase [Armatimonadota bacterium]MCX7777594.1 clostripain-related cysteine peptidase [Armatimonadota bacterium]MDW8024728.1 clostripain-related cysteine peptidase [Armatimonadota bacterium]